MNADIRTREMLRALPSGLKAEGANDLFQHVLLKPISDLMFRKGKNIRGQLVELGFSLSRPLEDYPESVFICSEILEYLHAGSLVIDDIQDGSLLRRGEPTLHSKYGVPLALNTGNWLYFWPMELIRELKVDPTQKLLIYEKYQKALLRAHMGQALDVGVRIDSLSRDQIHKVCLLSLELKTGALTSLALSLGAIIGGASDDQLSCIEKFGVDYGIALQMFDDTGNFIGRRDPSKRWEDLYLRRPSWVWACLTVSRDEDLLSSFTHAVNRLPDILALESWIVAHPEFADSCLAQARERLQSAILNLNLYSSVAGNDPSVHSRIQSLQDLLVSSYA